MTKQNETNEKNVFPLRVRAGHIVDMKKTLLIASLLVFLPLFAHAATQVTVSCAGTWVSNGDGTQSCVTNGSSGNGSGNTVTPTASGGCQNGVCTYVPLEPLPGVNQNGINFASFVSGMFRLFITLGALFAVLMLVIAGIGYMISDTPVNIQAAKDRAKAALYGLLLLTACWLILYTINPNLLRFDLFNRDVPAVANSGAPGTTAPTSPNYVAQNPIGLTTQEQQNIQNNINSPDPTTCTDAKAAVQNPGLLTSAGLFLGISSTVQKDQIVRDYVAACAAKGY